MASLDSSIFGSQPLIQDLMATSRWYYKLKVEPANEDGRGGRGRLFECVDIGAWRMPSLVITQNPTDAAASPLSATADWTKWKLSKRTDLRVWPGHDGKQARDACRAAAKKSSASSSSSQPALVMERLDKHSKNYRIVVPNLEGHNEAFEWRSEVKSADKVALRSSLQDWKGSKNRMSNWSLVRLADNTSNAASLAYEDEDAVDDDATLADVGGPDDDADDDKLAHADKLGDDKELASVDVKFDEDADEGAPDDVDDSIAAVPLSHGEALIATFVGPRQWSKYYFKQGRGRLLWHTDAVARYGLDEKDGRGAGWNIAAVTSLVAILTKMEQLRQNSAAAASGAASSSVVVC